MGLHLAACTENRVEGGVDIVRRADRLSGTSAFVEPEQVGSVLEAVAAVPGLRVEGLMTIGRWDPDPERARPEFGLLATLAESVEGRTGVQMKWLSMGMSHDFEVAIEEGANLVRIGTGIFGPRPR